MEEEDHDAAAATATGKAFFILQIIGHVCVC